MPRNTVFHSQAHKPFRAQESLELREDRVTGPLSFLNPTRAAFRHNPAKEKTLDTANDLQNGVDADQPSEDKTGKLENERPASSIEFNWRSRDNRKGRHTLVVNPSVDPSPSYLVPKQTSALCEVTRIIALMWTSFPYWDVSYLVATTFTWGSVVWVINAFFVFLPLVQPKTEFKDEILTGGGVSAFIGATIFEIGSVLLMVEAVNENRSGCFGWALTRVLSGGEDGYKFRVRPDKDRCTHHHTNKGNFVGKGSIRGSFDAMRSQDSSSNSEEKRIETNSTGDSWVWFPSLLELKTHYLRELGFLASLSQFCGATIFWVSDVLLSDDLRDVADDDQISGFTALPGINNKLSQGLLDGIYWVPQMVGGSGFIISGFLYMLETQSKWYLPAWDVLGWHIGFWNLIGAFGFTLSGALGPAHGNSGAQYEAALATFWGSWAFLIGSTIQWYESLDKHPVETQKT